MDFHCRAVTLRGEMIKHLRAQRRDGFIRFGKFDRLDHKIAAQVERPECAVERMAADVAQRATAVVPKTAPTEGVDLGVVGALGGDRSLPQVPTQMRGHRLGGKLQARPLRPKARGTIGPVMNIGDLTDQTAFNPFAQQARAGEGRALVAHHREHAFLFRKVAQRARFPQRIAKRLLQHDRLAAADRFERDRKVHVIGRRDGDDINLVGHLGKHFAVVLEELCFGKSRACFAGVIRIDIAEESNAVATGDFGDVTQALAIATDGGDLKFGGFFLLTKEQVGRECGTRESGAGLDETAS